MLELPQIPVLFWYEYRQGVRVYTHALHSAGCGSCIFFFHCAIPLPWIRRASGLDLFTGLGISANGLLMSYFAIRLGGKAATRRGISYKSGNF